MSKPITLIAGLGNPEERYAKTLHNAGFWFVDELARQHYGQFKYEKRFDAETCKVQIEGKDIWLAKPQSYMNCSGGPLRAMLDYFRFTTEQALVVHDEIDLPPGTVRLKQAGGHGGHNGLRDIIQHCGRDFLRLRIGVGHPGSKDLVTSYVLKRAPSDIESDITRSIDDSLGTIPRLLSEGTEAAMKALHTQS